MEKKQMTKAQMQRRIEQSPLHLNRTRDFKTIYFDDKGLRLSCDDNEGYCLIETSAHTHVFRIITVAGVSRPYLYTQRFIEIALANDSTWKDENGQVRRSYSKLFEIIKNKEDKTEYNICWYVDLWLSNIFSPLYSIDETEIASFIVYEQYLHNIARSQVILSEHTEDMTNLQFVDALIDNEKKYLEGMKEAVIIHKKTDEEKTQEEVAALQEAMVQEKQGEGVGDGK